MASRKTRRSRPGRSAPAALARSARTAPRLISRSTTGRATCDRRRWGRPGGVGAIGGSPRGSSLYVATARRGQRLGGALVRADVEEVGLDVRPWRSRPLRWIGINRRPEITISPSGATAIRSHPRARVLRVGRALGVAGELLPARGRRPSRAQLGGVGQRDRVLDADQQPVTAGSAARPRSRSVSARSSRVSPRRTGRRCETRPPSPTATAPPSAARRAVAGRHRSAARTPRLVEVLDGGLQHRHRGRPAAPPRRRSRRARRGRVGGA